MVEKIGTITKEERIFEILENEGHRNIKEMLALTNRLKDGKVEATLLELQMNT